MKIADHLFAAEIFNTREIAWGAWLLIAIIAFLFGKSIRADLCGVLKALFVWNLMSWLVGMAVYIAIFIYLFYWIGLWTPELLKDTVFYILFSATVGMFKANKISEDKHFFLEMLKDNLKIGIFAGISDRAVYIRLMGRTVDRAGGGITGWYAGVFGYGREICTS